MCLYGMLNLPNEDAMAFGISCLTKLSKHAKASSSLVPEPMPWVAFMRAVMFACTIARSL
eukprot:CAMPEP_0204021164 /NCGR_PEP_ID=MMETSP0360-20130528/29909_1 /ASSEMBLY_ACC=CAM_ASM_000342 /TAXON_ID=268821 /ORGANISM="Scrippsiella Hangoei, Strain SHTV-5" /LENGTH=59 /DNA_ID=CAMNT_0050964533 /DNA_START=14 /DNA_END=189 /DNA_ORIENTATION=-